MSSNVPLASAYHVYAFASQLIHYAHCCSNYSDFLSRHWHRALVTRLLLQVYKVIIFPTQFRNSMDDTEKNVSQILTLLVLSVKMIFLFYGFADS